MPPVTNMGELSPSFQNITLFHRVVLYSLIHVLVIVAAIVIDSDEIHLPTNHN